MERVLSELDRKEVSEAVRIFLDACSHERVPADVRLKSWVRDKLGPEATRKLTSAMAGYRCFGCSRGIEPCKRCDKTGFVAVLKVCPDCIGFHSARCDFCNGSGLATYNLFPASFRASILSRRGNHAVSIVRKLVDSASELDRTPPSGDQDFQRLLACNRVAGVLENAVMTARQLISEGRASGDPVNRLIRSCVDASTDAQSQIILYLKRLAASQRQAAEDAAPDHKDGLIAHAEFLESLSASGNFDGTMLQHPFVHGSPELVTDAAIPPADPGPAPQIPPGDTDDTDHVGS